MWRRARWVSGIREWEQAIQTRHYEMFFPWVSCRKEFQTFATAKKRRVGWVGGKVKKVFEISTWIDIKKTMITLLLVVHTWRTVRRGWPGKPCNKSRNVLVGSLLESHDITVRPRITKLRPKLNSVRKDHRRTSRWWSSHAYTDGGRAWIIWAWGTWGP